MPRDAGHEERDHVRLLFGPVPRHHLHRPAAAPQLLLHHQPAAALLPHLLPGAAQLLPARRLRGEGLAGGHRAAGANRLPDDGGGEHASLRKRSSHR